MRLNKKNIYYGGLRRKLREPNKTFIDSFNEFINMVGVNSELTNAILLIGITYSYSRNLNREIENLQPDFCGLKLLIIVNFQTQKILQKINGISYFFHLV